MKYKLWCRQREIYSHNEHIFNDLEEIKETLADYHSADCNVYTLMFSLILYCPFF